ncbi:hypothetical protein BFJ68_g17171 [Fusarium oxysporum]|uniref:Uncharacterized protein n=1 Tax=Fusarium oxysporum TaxID=5507 RepID=A0A420P0I4_FUSOX|nr:hypothetical protein BFJ68_g17171 [Fusarium oxysporum]
MHDHTPAHGKKASQHTSATPLWRACKLQTYFTAKGLIDYFVVGEEERPSSSSSSPAGGGEPAPSQEEGKLFGDLKADVDQASRDLDSRAEIVQGVEASRADRVPWLVRTGFAAHLRGLRDSEILSSYALPRSIDPDGYGEDEDSDVGDVEDDDDDDDVRADLSRILAAADSTLRDAYASCSDTSPDGKMTQHRAKRLSNFRGGENDMSSANASKFREYKNESSLKSYFRIAKQLLAYYYRVVFRDDGHFSREGNAQVLPRDVIESTSWQQKAMQGIVNALRKQDKTSRDRSGGCGDEEERDVELKRAIRTFYISLICQTVGSRPFRSAVLSFCAMLSRKRNRTRQRDG